MGAYKGRAGPVVQPATRNSEVAGLAMVNGREIESYRSAFRGLSTTGRCTLRPEVLAPGGDLRHAKRTSRDLSPAYDGRRARVGRLPCLTPRIERPAGVSAVNTRSQTTNRSDPPDSLRSGF